MIESTKNPGIKALTGLIKKARQRREEASYVVEGRRMFEEAPEEYIKKIYASEGFIKRYGEEPGIKDKLQSAGYEMLRDDVYEYASDTKTPQGIMCIMKQREYTLDEVLGGDNPFIIFAENVQDPGNMGTIIRAAEGAGVTGVVISADTVDIFNPKTIRSTMGSVYRMPICRVDDMKAAIQKAKDAGIRVYAAHLEGRKNYHEVEYTGGCGFILGNEGNGITGETADAATELIKIPMKGEVESLNVAVAATVLMFEAARQRG